MSLLGNFSTLPVEIITECIGYLQYDYCALREVNKTWRKLCNIVNGFPRPYVRLKYAVWQNRVENSCYVKIATNQPLNSTDRFSRNFTVYISSDNLISSACLFRYMLNEKPCMLGYVRVDTLRLLLQQDTHHNIPIGNCTNDHEPEFYDIIVEYMKRRHLKIDIMQVRDIKLLRSMIAHNYCENINAIQFGSVDNGRVSLCDFHIDSYFTVQDLVELPDFILTAKNFWHLHYHVIRVIEAYCQMKYGNDIADQPAFCGISVDWIKNNAIMFNNNNLLKFKDKGVIDRRDCQDFDYSRYITIWDSPSQPVTVEELIENGITDIPTEVIMCGPAALCSKHERRQHDIRLTTYTRYDHARQIIIDACNDTCDDNL